VTRVYKILPRTEWAAAEAAGVFAGSAVDHQDGYIHFSTAAQAGETARRYFADRADLVVLEVEGDVLGPALKWEPSRGGDLFPHLYSVLAPSQVLRVLDAPLGADGIPRLPL
jgi:uncharacterized protein (DUF952 family)